MLGDRLVGVEGTKVMGMSGTCTSPTLPIRVPVVGAACMRSTAAARWRGLTAAVLSAAVRRGAGAARAGAVQLPRDPHTGQRTPLEARSQHEAMSGTGHQTLAAERPCLARSYTLATPHATSHRLTADRPRPGPARQRQRRRARERGQRELGGRGRV
eukprot:2917179-Rhodomonas_salina.2